MRKVESINRYLFLKSFGLMGSYIGSRLNSYQRDLKNIYLSGE